MSTEHEEIRTDVLVLGSGVAGARAAIAAAEAGRRVTLVTKGEFTRSGATPIAVYACNAVYRDLNPADSFACHFEDTVAGGAHLNNQRLVEAFVTEAPERLREIDAWGARFNRVNGKFEQVLQPGHRHPRALHIESRTGSAFSAVFRKEVRRRASIRVLNDTFVTGYLTDRSSGAVVGAAAVDLPGMRCVVFLAKAVVDATGGGMNLYALHSSPPDCTGDGYAMAYRVGAELIDMEFVQFYPGLAHPESHRGNTGVPYLVRVALRGHILNSEGERFMARYDPERMEWATRDVLARAMFSEIRAGRGTPHGGVWFDATHLGPEKVEEALRPHVRGWVHHGVHLLESGLDLRRVGIEAAPAAHYFCGGIRINEHCETDVPGLYAAGEATGGVDGANRLTGNALSEHLVFGARAGVSAARRVAREEFCEPDPGQLERAWEGVESIRRSERGRRPHEVLREVQDCAWANLAAIRDARGLTEAIEVFRSCGREAAEGLRLQNGARGNPWELLLALEVQNLCLVGEMVASSALMREETRASHQRVEFPEPSPRWLRNVVLRKRGEAMEVTTSPLVLAREVAQEVGHG
ncbi:MAG: FAD-binding protein [Candidatus Tectomicrobia bacterium]|nr:FAD-binding protein [Candidatus Tectomicrobia bacterium]